jgi:YHS domain-containing protein
VKADSPVVEHAGKKYYFCCEGCAKQFRQQPEKFLGS